MTKTYLNKNKIRVIDEIDLEFLKKQADLSPLKRSRINLHNSFLSNAQDMVICFKKNSYVEPHFFEKKNTIFRLISGKLLVRFFDNKNKVKKEFILDKKNFFLLINKNTIYDVKAISKYVFVNEFMEGPFKKKLFKTP